MTTREAAPTPSAEDERAAYSLCLYAHEGDSASLRRCFRCKKTMAALAAARAEEREACARACEGWSAPDNEFQMQGEDDLSRGLRFAAGLRARIAAAIRARTPASDSTESAPAPAPALAPDQCPACGHSGLSMDKLGGACPLVSGGDGTGGCPNPLAWLDAQRATVPARNPAPAPPAEAREETSTMREPGSTPGGRLDALSGQHDMAGRSGYEGGSLPPSSTLSPPAPASTAATGEADRLAALVDERTALRAEVARKDAALERIAALTLIGNPQIHAEARAALAPAEKEGT